MKPKKTTIDDYDVVFIVGDGTWNMVPTAPIVASNTRFLGSSCAGARTWPSNSKRWISMVLFVPGERRRDVDCDVDEALDERAPCDGFPPLKEETRLLWCRSLLRELAMIWNCRCNYQNEIDRGDELDDLKHHHQRRRRRDDAWAWRFFDKLLWRVSRRSTGEASRKGSVGPLLLLSSTIGVNRSTIIVRRRRYNVDESFLMNSWLNFDPTINYIAGLAALTLRTLKITISDQKWTQ